MEREMILCCRDWCAYNMCSCIGQLDNGTYLLSDMWVLLILEILFQSNSSTNSLLDWKQQRHACIYVIIKISSILLRYSSLW